MDPIERKFTLHVPSSTQNLAIIREFVNSIGVQAGLDEMDISKVELAVDEACANVIEHAYSHDLSKDVTIRATFDDAALHIDVEDTGRGFDPSSIQQAELERLVAERKSGGLGMRLIKSVMDEVRYEFEPGQKNVLHMMKRIKKKA
ncbi:MAG: ATP-binding protein [Pyrinomonadaceae bacterium]|nr:ATP-binding protein [Pyrinomonadaceae bacterium]